MVVVRGWVGSRLTVKGEMLDEKVRKPNTPLLFMVLQALVTNRMYRGNHRTSATHSGGPQKAT